MTGIVQQQRKGRVAGEAADRGWTKTLGRRRALLERFAHRTRGKRNDLAAMSLCAGSDLHEDDARSWRSSEAVSRYKVTDRGAGASNRCCGRSGGRGICAVAETRNENERTKDHRNEDGARNLAKSFEQACAIGR